MYNIFLKTFTMNNSHELESEYKFLVRYFLEASSKV
jgi:hypothetical protein